jgi:MFS family permease
VLLARPLRALAARHLVAADAALRAVTLAVIPLLYATGALRPGWYVALLAASSLLHAWGISGQYTLVAEQLPPQARTAANALLSGFTMAAFVIGPALAGVLVAAAGPALAGHRRRRHLRHPGRGSGHGHPVPALAAFAAGGLLYAPYPALSVTLFQRESPPELLSQVLAARGALTVLATPLGTALGGPLTTWVGAQHTLLASAAATVAAGLAATALLTMARARGMSRANPAGRAGRRYRPGRSRPATPVPPAGLPASCSGARSQEQP